MSSQVRSRLWDAACVVLLASLAVGLLWPVTLGGRTLLSTPLLLANDPWHAYLPQFEAELWRKGANWMSDPMYQFFPWRSYVNEELRRNTFPLWNPRQFFGTPFLANDQSQVFYPDTWLLLPLPAEQAMGWSAALFLFLAGTFMFGFLRTLGCRHLAALIGAVAFMTNGYFVAWLNWPGIRAVIAWLPLILLCYERAVRGRSLPWALAGAVAFCLQLLVGHMDMTIYLLIAFGLYALARAALAARERGWRAGRWPLAALGIIVLLGSGLATGQVLPALELGRVSTQLDLGHRQ